MYDKLPKQEKKLNMVTARTGLLIPGPTDNQHFAMGEQPVNGVRWIHRDELKPNDYNPNNVAPPELALLAISILIDGWTQPIVINPDRTIVDGFHRYLVSGQDALMQRFGGWVPYVELAPPSREAAMMATIRHNRARGTHAVLPMAEIVQQMIKVGLSVERIMHELQMEEEEVKRLAVRVGIPDQDLVRDKGFGKSWAPK